MSDYIVKPIDELLGNENDYIVKTGHCGDIRVHVQGYLNKGKCTFITVHDLGTNHRSMVAFVNSPVMREIKKEACFLHVVVPGHEPNASDLRPDDFPSLQILGQELIYILDYFNVQSVIGIGDGAGAIVLANLSLLYAYRTRALLLVNCAAIVNTPSYLFRTNYTRWRSGEMLEMETYFLSYHKYGIMGLKYYDSIFRFYSQPIGEYEVVTASNDYKRNLSKYMNASNVKMYVRSFLSRNSLTLQDCRAQLLLMAGSLSPYASIDNVNEEDNQNVCCLDTVSEVCDLISEAPGTVARKILYYCQCNRLLMNVPNVDLDHYVFRNFNLV